MNTELPEAEAALLAATMKSDNLSNIPKANQTEHCISCGAATPQLYCGECGLKNDDLRRSLWKLISETLGGIFSFESRMWRTWGALVFKPGKVAREYADGARTRYSAPIRVYLVVSLLLFSFLAISKTNLFALAVTEKTPAEIEAQIEALKTVEIDEDEKIDPNQATEEIIQIIKNGESALTDEQLKVLIREGEIGKYNYKPLFFQSQKVFDALSDKNAADEIGKTFEGANAVGFDGESIDVRKAFGTFLSNPNAFNSLINTWVPRVMFFMVPMVMFIGVIFIRGPNALLYDHLIHAFYIQSMFFMALLGAILLSNVMPGSIVARIVIIGFAIYLPLSLKKMFRRGWFKTIWTTIWVGGIYSTVLFLALSLIGVKSFIDLAA